MPRINATLACKYCQKRHERCERLSEEHTCMNYRKRSRLCISFPGYKRRSKTRKLIMEPFPNINPYGTTETFQNTFINKPSLSYLPFVHGIFMPNITLFPTNDLFFRTLHFYKNTITTPPINPYRTTKTLQNAVINQSSSYNNDEPELNNDQNITPSSDSFSTMSNNEQNITPFSNSFPTGCSNDISSSKTQHSYNNVITTTPNIDLYEIIETFQDMLINQSPSTSSSSFIHDKLELNNEQNIISSSSSFSTSCSNDSFFFETQHSYNNIVTTTPNINTYGSVETFRNTFNPHHHPKSSVIKSNCLFQRFGIGNGSLEDKCAENPEVIDVRFVKFVTKVTRRLIEVAMERLNVESIERSGAVMTCKMDVDKEKIDKSKRKNAMVSLINDEICEINDEKFLKTRLNQMFNENKGKDANVAEAADEVGKNGRSFWDSGNLTDDMGKSNTFGICGVGGVSERYFSPKALK
ncbi:31349_t:CDS:2, partial [Gigaspora margarita]